MTFRDWLKNTDIDPTRALCISLGTDGIKPDTCNLLSISIAKLGQEPTTIYVRGGDAARVQKYTGLYTDKYEKEAVGRARAFELLQDWLENTEFLVSYNTQKFFNPWIREHLLELSDFPCLDISSVAKLVDSREPFPDVDSVCELSTRVEQAMPHLMSGYSVDALYKRFLPVQVNDNIPLVNRIMNLYLLYLILLDSNAG
jgi:hypothetical protein